MTEKINWIKCSERLPEHGQRCLVYYIGKNHHGYNDEEINVYSASFVKGQYDTYWSFNEGARRFLSFCDNSEDVTHWMPLPEPPND